MENDPTPSEVHDTGPFYHGTKADLKAGDVLEPGRGSNYGERRTANYVYLTATLDAATWGAELAVGEGPGRIYRVDPTGPLVNDPNLTDKKFPGNPTRSYRTQQPLRVVGEVVDWEEHSPAVLQEDARPPREAQAAGHRGDQRLTRHAASRALLGTRAATRIDGWPSPAST
jgi:hypothetical protein